MPRIRSVKPEYFTHPKVQACSLPARLLFISLWTEADDEGRLHDQPRRLGAAAFGETEPPNVDELLHELAQRGLLERYEARGWKLIQIHDWTDHQRINRPSPSKLPAPRGRGRRESSMTPPGGLTESSVNGGGVLMEDSPPDLGKERSKERSKEQGTQDLSRGGATAESGNVGVALGDVIAPPGRTEAPSTTIPPPAHGLTPLQDQLLADLKRRDDAFGKFTFARLNKLNAEFGKPVVLDMLRRLREEQSAGRAPPKDPYPYARAICREIAEKAKASEEART